MESANNHNNTGRNNGALPVPVEETSPRSMNGVYRFFCWCAGSNLEVLKNYPTDYNKHFGTGTAVVMTGVFAFISSTYAISTVFKGAASWLIVLFFGLAWALFIFFLDRYLVSSMRKTRSFWNQTLIALPRILLAVLIGLTIARPLELKMFEPEIMEYLAEEKRKEIAAIDQQYTDQLKTEEADYKNRMDGLANGGSMASDIARVRELEKLIADGNRAVQAANEAVGCECNGRCGTMKRGRGPACRQLELEYARINADYKSNKRRYEEEIANINQRIAENKTSHDQEVQNARSGWENRRKEIENTRADEKLDKDKNAATSLLAQHQALSMLSDTESGVMIMIVVVTILFIFVETAPILVKLMSEAGPYDQAIEDLEYEYNSESRQRRYLIREELKLNKGLISRMAVEQREVIRKAIDEWKRQQREQWESEQDKDDNDTYQQSRY